MSDLPAATDPKIILTFPFKTGSALEILITFPEPLARETRRRLRKALSDLMATFRQQFNRGGTSREMRAILAAFKYGLTSACEAAGGTNIRIEPRTDGGNVCDHARLIFHAFRPDLWPNDYDAFRLRIEKLLADSRFVDFCHDCTSELGSAPRPTDRYLLATCKKAKCKQRGLAHVAYFPGHGYRMFLLPPEQLPPRDYAEAFVRMLTEPRPN